MSVHASRSAQPITDAPRGAAMGTWGLWLAIVVSAMFVAGLATAALYLQTGEGAWPPDGIPIPGRGRALLAVLFVGLATAASTWALVDVTRRGRRAAAVGLAWSGAALTAALIALIADLRAVGFRWDEHAYASIYWTLTGGTMLFVGIGMLIVGAVLLQMMTGLVDEERHLELTNATIAVWFVLGSGTVLLALVHLLPAAGAG